jgi:hypothetical protein
MTSKRVVTFVVIGVVLMFVSSIAACGGLFYFLYQDTNNKFSPIVDDIFVAIQEEKSEQVYRDITSPEFQQSVTQEHFAGICASYRELGMIKSKTMTSFNVNYNNGQQYAGVAYSAEFDKSDGTITAKFRHVDGDWKIVSIYIDSEYFTQTNATFSCSECEGPVARHDHKCPNCGTVFKDPAA